MSRLPIEAEDVHILVLLKGDDRHIFFVHDDKIREAMQTLARYAASPDINLNWYDAACLSTKLRLMHLESQRERGELA